MTTLGKLLLAGLASVALVAASPTARADEREFILSLEPAFALANTNDQTAYGAGGGVDLSYGVTDAIALRTTGALTAHSIGKSKFGPAGTMLAYHVGVGLTYTIDILRLVPYLDFAIGLVGIATPSDKGGQNVNNQLGIEVGIGVDYLIDRRFAVGVVVRYHAFLTALSDLPIYLYVGPRLAVHFGG